MPSHVAPAVRYRQTSGIGTDPLLDVVMGVVWHITASEATSQFGWFNGQSGGIESTWHVARDSQFPTEQYRPANHEADANYRGNRWKDSRGRVCGMLSIEFQGADANTGRYSPWQVREGLRLADWAQRQYNFRRKIATSYRSGGVGWHVMFGAGRGKAAWSNAAGKACPGPSRIVQLQREVFPAFLRGDERVVFALGQRTLGMGDTGPDVTQLQQLLGADPDGDFGPTTNHLVVTLQRGAGLDPDGLVGPTTLRALRIATRPLGKPIQPVPEPIPVPVPTHQEVDMQIVLDPDGKTQWLCDAQSKRHITLDERAVRLAAGVPYVGGGDGRPTAEQRGSTLAALRTTEPAAAA